MSGQQYKLETVLPNCFETVGEGPHWDPSTQRLVCVDFLNGGILRWDASSNEAEKVCPDGTVGFVIPRSKGDYVIGLNRSVAELNFDTKDVKTYVGVDEGTKNCFNDAKCDAVGRLWAGTIKFGLDPITDKLVLGVGSLFSLSKDHQLNTHLTKLGISNGLDWTDDNSVMYFIDSPTHSVVAFDFDLTTGSIKNQRTVVATENDGSVPDGMCVDADGKLWVAFCGGSKVCKFDPETGKTLHTVKLPVTNVTSCCFGGKNLDELYITSGRKFIPESEIKSKQPLAGSLFRLTGQGLKGRPANNFEG